MVDTDLRREPTLAEPCPATERPKLQTEPSVELDRDPGAAVSPPFVDSHAGTMAAVPYR